MTTHDRPPRGPAPVPGKPWEPADEPLRRWESLVERLIREAQDDGKFDGLPFQGERLPEPDDAYAGEQAGAFRILRNAGVAPAWIEADKEARRVQAEIEQLFERAARTSRLSRRPERDRLQRLVRAYNSAVLQLNHEAPTMQQHRVALDLRSEVERLERIWRDVDVRRSSPRT